MRNIILIGWLSIGLVIGACSPPSSTDPEAPPYIATGIVSHSLPEISKKLQDGDLTSEELVRLYLDRISKVDRDGPSLRSVLTLNPDALSEAKRLDALRADGQTLGPLHGIPVLLKDNIESRDNMPTTAGALALKDNITGRDSPLVAGLREAGAIILGKTNLSQWANFRSNDSMSGWSALGGQVRNPHILDHNPCGSSSGSGVAVAASLASGAVGTETNGSIICPSTINGIVGFKPTVGLVPQDYIIPISSTQDTAGPMTKTVTGAAMMLSAMATTQDNLNYVATLNKDSLSGTRVGVMRFAKGSNPDIIALFDRAVSDLEAAGAIPVEIERFDIGTDNFRSKSRAILNYEFKATLNAYLADTPATVKVKSLSELIAFNEDNADVELALFDQSIFKTAVAMGPLSEEAYLNARRDVLAATRTQGIDALMAEYDVSVMVSPSGPLPGRINPIKGDVWPPWAGAGYLAAMAGYPHLSVPMGEANGLPVGLSFFAGHNEDAQLLSYGYAYEQATQRRVEPQYLPGADESEEFLRAMKPTACK